MEYIVLDSSSISGLIAIVNGKMTAGWVCQGGIAIAYSVSQGYTAQLYCQAMIKTNVV